MNEQIFFFPVGVGIVQADNVEVHHAQIVKECFREHESRSEPH